MQLPVFEHHRRLPCPEFIKIESVPALDEETIVLGVGCCYNSNGRLLKSTYIQQGEMVMSHLKIYKLVAINLFGNDKKMAQTIARRWENTYYTVPIQRWEMGI